MLQLVLLCSALQIAQDAPKPSGESPPPPASQAQAEAQVSSSEAEALAKYNGMKDSVAETGAAHWKMGQWCEQNGLRPEAYFHYGKVIELEPRRDAAWQKLGFKKHNGRWMTADQVAAEASQKKVDKEWALKFKKWHKDVHGGKKREETRAALDAITDQAAVPSIYREFCGGSPTDQEIGLQLLGQIEGPIASKAIAVLAVYGKSSNVRRHATELLRGRPAEEFLDMLVAFMKDLLKYEVRPVGGPGSPGVLFVEGERFNVQRFYAPPPPPSYTPRPGDSITYDDNGLPVVSRSETSIRATGPKVGVPGSKTLVTERDAFTTTTETYSFANAIAESQRATLSAQAQLAGDIAQVDALNDRSRQFNELVMGVTRGATGKNPGQTAKEWRDMLARANEGRSSSRTRQPAPKPTIDEMVPLAYVPNLAAVISFQAETRFLTMTTVDS